MLQRLELLACHGILERKVYLKFVANVSKDELFGRLHTALEKYGGVFQMGHSPAGDVCVQKGDIMYDIVLDKDSFRIVWRNPAVQSCLAPNQGTSLYFTFYYVSKFVHALRKYATYRKMLSSMSIIGFSLQEEFCVQPESKPDTCK